MYNPPSLVLKKSPNTNYDWLSRDAKEVQSYIEDPYCGFIPTSGFFNDTATTEIYTLSLHDALPICSNMGVQYTTLAERVS